MEKIKIGKIVNAVALKGEVKIYNYSDYKERFEEIEKILVMDGRELIEMKIENIRYQKNMVIAKLGGVDDRTQAEKLKDCDVFITEEDLRILPEDTFYIRDLIGCAVVDDAAGQKIGTVKDVIQNCAQDIYQIELTSGGEALVPAVAQFIKKIDIENKIIKINVIPGLIGGAEESYENQYPYTFSRDVHRCDSKQHTGTGLPKRCTGHKPYKHQRLQS